MSRKKKVNKVLTTPRNQVIYVGTEGKKLWDSIIQSEIYKQITEKDGK